MRLPRYDLGRQAVADLDFEAVEMAARRQALRLAARALEQRLNADTSDHAGPELPCSCGGPAQYHGRHDKTFESVLGPLQLQRAYYYCAQCESGFCPRDRALKITSSLTAGYGFCGNRVRIDVCRIRLYVYDRCHAPTDPRKPSASIA